jgi:hypothetical protein
MYPTIISEMSFINPKINPKLALFIFSFGFENLKIIIEKMHIDKIKQTDFMNSICGFSVFKIKLFKYQIKQSKAINSSAIVIIYL